MNKPLDTSL